MRKRNLVGLFLAMTLAAGPALAADMQGHAGHTAAGAGMIMLGQQTVNGAKAMAQLKDVKEVMAAAGKQETHHLQVTITDDKGSELKVDAAAVKLTPPDGDDITLPLVFADGHFGADLNLANKGPWRFAIAAKLADGSKRQFVFKQDVK